MKNLVSKVVSAYMVKISTGISEEGRRTYFEFPYHAGLKDQLKMLGAKWDAGTKRWWAAKNHKNISEMTDAFNALFGGSPPAMPPKGREVDFEFPFTTEYHDPDRGRTQPLREVLKGLGARWDGTHKVWYAEDTHPNFKRMTEVYDAAMGRAKKIDDAQKDKVDAEKANLDALKKDVGYVRWNPLPQDAVKLVKENGGVFDGKGWLLPTFKVRQEVEKVILKIIVEKEREKDIKRLGFDPEKFGRFTKWSKNKSPDWVKGDVLVLWFDLKGHRGSLSHKKGDAVVIQGAQSQWVPDDAMSFGGPSGWDKGWAHTYFVRDATPEEAGPALGVEKKRLTKADATRRVKELEREFESRGQRPSSAKDRGQAYLPISKEVWIVGGGAFFFIGSRHVWYVRRNGADGDTWANSNSVSGIAYSLPKTPELEAEIKSLHELLHGKTLPQIKTL